MSEFTDLNPLKRVHRQILLSSADLKRAEVLETVIEEPVRFVGNVAVWRNHAIEPLLPLLEVFLGHAGLELQFVLGEYDDGCLISPPRDCNAELVWFDLDRISLDDVELSKWFVGRIARVMSMANGPVIVVPVSARQARIAAVAERLQMLPGVRCADPWSLCEEVDVSLVDERTMKLTGSRISRKAQLQIARALGMRWFPATLLPPIKMIAVDLDETLHRGVLGEDGSAGLEVTPGHRRLHSLLKDLTVAGTMLALVSRNEPADVVRLFAERESDYGIALEDFIAVEVSWGSKAEAIRNAATKARIGEEAVVFVDDNAGELLNVGMLCPNVGLVHASGNPDQTIDALQWHAGLWQWSVDATASLRASDLKANWDRERLQEEIGDFDRYVAELGVQAEITVDNEEYLSRLADLSAKTNQFNLNLLRLGEIDLLRVMKDPNAHVASVSLADRLSDSGVIALLVARRNAEQLVVDELAMSCRALGRGLESILLSQALKSLPCWGQVREISFRVKETDRNLPARRWIAAIADFTDDAIPAGEVVVDSQVFNAIEVPGVVALSVRLCKSNPG